MKKEAVKQVPKYRIAVIFIALLVAIAIFGAARSMQPNRSTAAYCKVYQQEKSRLASQPGSTYSSTVFDENLNDPQQFIDSFAKLERVAPKEILPEVSALKKVYATMKASPSQTIQAGMSGASAEKQLAEWTNAHCR